MVPNTRDSTDSIERTLSENGAKIQQAAGAPNENIVQNHFNIALLNVF